MRKKNSYIKLNMMDSRNLLDDLDEASSSDGTAYETTPLNTTDRRNHVYNETTPLNPTDRRNRIYNETTPLNPIYRRNRVYNETTETLPKRSADNRYKCISKKKIAIAFASFISLSMIVILLSKLLSSHDSNDSNMTTEAIYNATTSIMTTAFSNITSSLSSVTSSMATLFPENTTSPTTMPTDFSDITSSMATLFPANITSPTTEDPRCAQLPECCDNEGRWICS